MSNRTDMLHCINRPIQISLSLMFIVKIIVKRIQGYPSTMFNNDLQSYRHTWQHQKIKKMAKNTDPVTVAPTNRGFGVPPIPPTTLPIIPSTTEKNSEDNKDGSEGEDGKTTTTQAPSPCSPSDNCACDTAVDIRSQTEKLLPGRVDQNQGIVSSKMRCNPITRLKTNVIAQLS